ncbi:MAG: hypothetical protein WCA35_16105, partial [Kovacikia sp.]
MPGSLMEEYLTAAGQGFCLKPIPAKNSRQFLARALDWVQQQPRSWPVLLDNCVAKELLPSLILAAPKLRWSGRAVYHFCHDLALSYNPLGFFLRKIAFTLLSPKA